MAGPAVPELPSVRTKYVLLAVVLGVVVLAGLGLLVFSPLSIVFSSSATPARTHQCGKPDWVEIDLHSDQDMAAAAVKVRADHLDADVVEQTQQQSYEEFKRLFADQPELLKIARPESLPAAVKIMPKPGVSAIALADRLTKEFPPPAEVRKYVCSELQSLVPTTR